MSRLKRRTWDSLDFEWKNGDIHNFDIPSDIEPDYDSPSIPNNPHTYENKSNLRSKNKKDYVTSPSNRTIINLTEDGATIQCSYDNNQSPRKNTFAANHTNRDNEKKTIVVEVHHTSTTTCGKTACNYPPPMKNDCDSDSISLSSSATLSSAIADEIQRRKMVSTMQEKAEKYTYSSNKQSMVYLTDSFGDKKVKIQHLDGMPVINLHFKNIFCLV